MCCSGFNPSSKDSAAQTDLVTQRREPFNWLLLGMGPQADFDFWVESKTDLTDWKLNRFFFFSFSQCAYYFISLVPKEI